MQDEIPLSEFRRDIRQQKKERQTHTVVERSTREPEKPKKEPWEKNPQALSKDDYDHLTRYGRRRLKRPRPVWLTYKKRWTVGAPVNPIEWQILIQSEPARGRKRVARIKVEEAMATICGQFWIHEYTFSGCLERLVDRHLLKTKGRFRRSRRAGKWLSPDLDGPRAGGEWHQRHILDFVEEINRLCGCYTYADRGYCSGVAMPDVIVIRPRLVRHARYYEPQVEPLEWDMANPIYAEFKSAVDMREHPGRFKEQLERYDGIPLYLQVEAKVYEAKDMLEDRGRREVSFFDLLKKPEGDMVFLTGSERPRSEGSFKLLIERIKDAFFETYDKKARLVKTGVDPQGREHHSLILYDALNTPKNVGQVIPDYADDVEDFAGLYFGERYLGRITTADYVYVPERKPTPENKTWRWEKTKTKGARFRSFAS